MSFKCKYRVMTLISPPKKIQVQPQLQSKLPNVGTTIFTVMSSLAAKHQAINLGQGFPDFPMNEELISLVNEAMISGHNQYVHMNGYIPLRESIAEKAEYLYGNAIHPDTQVTVTPGGTYAIFEVPSEYGDNIGEFTMRIFNEWLPSTGYKLTGEAEIECETKNGTVIWMPIKK